MIILMGVAGAGKSQQGKLLADEYGYAWISTGEILRVLVTGKRRQEMLKGNLLSDAEMVAIMDKVFELIDTNQEFVLDGFPRTIKQADWLLDQIHAGRFALNSVIHLQAEEMVVRDRLIKRGRVDDTDEAITQRFQEYRSVTLPILDHLRNEEVHVCDIGADQNSRVVHDEIMNCIRVH